MPEYCLRCLEDSDVHVVVATEAHGLLIEEFWCRQCYDAENLD